MWDELPSEEGVDDVEIETPPFERSEEVIAAIHDSVAVLLDTARIFPVTEQAERRSLRREAVLAASSLFAYDNSMTRRARAPDALDAHLLNLSDGGKNTKLRMSSRLALQLRFGINNGLFWRQ